MKTKKYLIYLSDEDKARLDKIKESLESPTQVEAVRQTIRMVYKEIVEGKEKEKLIRS